jgi:hypothetical protein
MLSDYELSPTLVGGDKGEGEYSINAQLFSKRSQVRFMPYGVVLKDERRTSDRLNIEHRTSNVQCRIKRRTSDTEHLTAISFSFQPFDSAQGREPVERPF